MRLCSSGLRLQQCTETHTYKHKSSLKAAGAKLHESTSLTLTAGPEATRNATFRPDLMENESSFCPITAVKKCLMTLNIPAAGIYVI